MILERRAYTLRPGLAQDFWDLQIKWNTVEAIPHYLARNIGYFHAFAGPAEQIVHLQRYDDFVDWKQRVASNQKPGRGEYYTTARKLLNAQENSFYAPSPVARLSPLWHEERDWVPGEPPFAAANTGTAIVVEDAIDLLPGTVPAYWARMEQFSNTDGFEADSLVGMFSTIVGQLHRVLEYRWFQTFEETGAYLARLDANAEWREARAELNALTTRSHKTLLRPAPVPWMQALFTKTEFPAG